jgi:hypothetical protein
MPGLHAESLIGAKNYCRLVIILNAEAPAIGWDHWNLNRWNDLPFPCTNITEYSFPFLKLGEFMPGLHAESLIGAKNYCRLVIILNTEAPAIGGVHWNLN